MVQQMIRFHTSEQSSPGFASNPTWTKTYGFAGGYNKALKQVKADYYVSVEFGC